MRTGLRLLAVGTLVAAALVAAAGGSAAPPAAAAACEQGAGVTVVVDCASLGSGVQTDCAPGDPASGVEALRTSGHEPTRAAQQPGYFVCRIDGKPADDPCQRASPEDAYWSYWTARPGGSWSYSGTGPADRDPAPGTVEGWAFGAGEPPSVAPPRERSAAAPSPRPTPSRSAAAAVRPAPRSPEAAPATAAPSRTAPAAATGARPPSPTPVSSPTPSSVPSPVPSSTRSPVARQDAVAADRAPGDGGPGSVASPLAALGVVLLLGAAGAFQLQRRRRDTA